MATHCFRYELWVPIERANEASDAIYRQELQMDPFDVGEPCRAADVPATPNMPGYATFYVDREVFGILWRRFLRRSDEMLADLAREFGGSVYRYPITEVHVTQTKTWEPRRN